MSDVHAAPAPAQSAPPPAPSEAVINPNPVSLPAPVGPQAPPKPVGDIEGSSHRPESRRETIKRAFERAPGMGHNNPPEPMAKERTTPPRTEPKKAKSEPPEAIDLKKRPTDQAPPPRGEHGHFAAKSPTPNTAEARRQQPGAQQPPRPAAQQLPNHAPYREPPSPRGWHEQARAEWATTPESVRGEVHRMHKEFSRAYQTMNADRQTMNSIRHFEQMAKQHGTTLDKALSNYVGIEEQLRADPIAGLNTIVNNLNLRTSSGQQISLRDIAWYLNNQTPEAHQSLQMRNQQTAQQQQTAQLFQAYNHLAKQNQQLIYGLRFNQTRRAVDRFAKAHPRLDELGQDIQRELRFGYDLPTAYRRAELLRPSSAPATQAAQTRAPSAQTRHMDRSISGAPTGGPTNGSGRPRKASASPRDAVANALRRVNGSI